MSPDPLRLEHFECQTCLQVLQVMSQDLPPDVVPQGHLDFCALCFGFELLSRLLLSSLPLPSDSDRDDASGESRPVLLRSEACSRALVVGVFSNVEFTTRILSLSLLLDLVRRWSGVGLSTAFLEVLFSAPGVFGVPGVLEPLGPEFCKFVSFLCELMSLLMKILRGVLGALRVPAAVESAPPEIE